MTKLVAEMSKLKSILLVLFIIGIVVGIVQVIEIFFGSIIMFYLALH
jgi:hypothetical protein